MTKIKKMGTCLLIVSMLIGSTSVVYAETDTTVIPSTEVISETENQEQEDLVLPMPSAVAATVRYSYSGSVKKTSDYESSYQYKANTSIYGTNSNTAKPSGAYVCWVETSTGSNSTYNTSFTTTGKYLMPYKQNLDSDDTCAENLYVGKYKLKLNVSTALTNMTSGTVSGTWSPDQF